ncbi:hypothetical protein ECDEC8D_4181 [Escherichia coli DEC8D]|uniref:Uncharacterized protein n=1 Tax=Escherichia coli TaxID=562 RepID=A0A2H4TV33_ECOLX|nr:hypothetical protein CV83915_03079 [Escherichia coli]EHW22184.1 hypothetical protein ECDEC8D_4181 [Escherichia coli DEC8D]EII46318.1 hypothetical protein EC23916_3659 [Escherichia coli 2.3916]
MIHLRVINIKSKYGPSHDGRGFLISGSNRYVRLYIAFIT